MRGNSSLEVRDALSVGVDQNGGYTVPDEFERQLIQALEENNVFRRLAKTIHTNSGTRTIPIAMDNGSASWIEEGAAIQESDMTFSQETLSAFKLAEYASSKTFSPRFKSSSKNVVLGLTTAFV